MRIVVGDTAIDSAMGTEEPIDHDQSNRNSSRIKAPQQTSSPNCSSFQLSNKPSLSSLKLTTGKYAYKGGFPEQSPFDYCDLGFFEKWPRNWAADFHTQCNDIPHTAGTRWWHRKELSKTDYNFSSVGMEGMRDFGQTYRPNEPEGWQDSLSYPHLDPHSYEFHTLDAAML